MAQEREHLQPLAPAPSAVLPRRLPEKMPDHDASRNHGNSLLHPSHHPTAPDRVHSPSLRQMHLEALYRIRGRAPNAHSLYSRQPEHPAYNEFRSRSPRDEEYVEADDRYRRGAPIQHGDAHGSLFQHHPRYSMYHDPPYHDAHASNRRHQYTPEQESYLRDRFGYYRLPDGRHARSNPVHSPHLIGAVHRMDPRQMVGSSSAVDHTMMMDPNKKVIIPRERTSRYLSEGDRRAILSRIEKGERQATLAKEYNVSRAAICNLYKNREEVLVRSDRDPNARHPKRQRIMKKDSGVNENEDGSVEGASVSAAAAAAVGTLVQIKNERSMADSNNGPITSDHPVDSASKDESSSNLVASKNEEDISTLSSEQLQEEVDSEEDLQELQVHELCSTSTIIKILFSVLRDGSTKHQHFRRAADRLIRLLIEEALLSLPKRIQSIKTSNGDTCEGMFFHRFERCCAISMESSGFSLLRNFQELEPDIAIGLAVVSCTAIQVVPAHVEKVTYNNPAGASHECTGDSTHENTTEDQKEKEPNLDQGDPTITDNCDKDDEKTDEKNLTTVELTKANENTPKEPSGDQAECENSQEITENSILSNEASKDKSVTAISQNQPRVVNASARPKVAITTEFHTWRMPRPASLQLVLLFDAICGTGLEACAVIQRLIDEEKVDESNIHYVNILSSLEGLRRIQKQFPHVKLITAQVDEKVDNAGIVRPGIGNFHERYWNIASELRYAYKHYG